MRDYYEPYARFSLERPLVLAGQLGCGARMTARILCARSGLPFVEMDRQIEHEVGDDLAAIAEREGPKRVAERARLVLERIALQRPWPVVALDRAWPSDAAFRLFGRKLDLVRIERPTAYLLERLEKEIHGAGAWVLGDRPFVFRNEEDLEAFGALREPLLERAGILLDAGDRHEHEVAEIVLEGLESVAHARAMP